MSLGHTALPSIGLYLASSLCATELYPGACQGQSMIEGCQHRSAWQAATIPFPLEVGTSVHVRVLFHALCPLRLSVLRLFSRSVASWGLARAHPHGWFKELILEFVNSGRFCCIVDWALVLLIVFLKTCLSLKIGTSYL